MFGQSSQTDDSTASVALYRALARFDLSGGTARADNVLLVLLKRDRAEITFDGTFYFEPAIQGLIRGAVFLGKGNVSASAPNSIFEQDNVRRMLGAGGVHLDFKTAVLRFSDDTLEALGLKIDPTSSAPEEARKLASALPSRLLRETGANLPARIAVSILNRESPGFFFAEFDKGSRGRFRLVLDYQGRLPAAHFGLDGGEKGLFFSYDSEIDSCDVWMAFFALADYQKGQVQYSDTYAVVNIQRYDMEVDVRDWKHVKLKVRMQMTALTDGLRAIPLVINETLTTRNDDRLKKAMRLKGARLADGGALAAVQEDWDGSVTLLLRAPSAKGQILEPILDFDGELLVNDPVIAVTAHYVRADSWYPRHFDLNRSLFDMTFRHKNGTLVASIGRKIREEETPEHDMLTEWRMDEPVALATFALGDFKVYTDKTKMENGRELDLDFYRVEDGQPFAARSSNVKTDFILAELNNCVRYFSALFGSYPYSRFGATYHPFPVGQGFPTMLMLPRSDTADRYTYSFIAHEASHQWWGDIVTWRSYRDQWLSEGFADYSGVLYTGLRDKDRNSPKELLRRMHDDLLNPPVNLTGLGKGRLADIGPIIMGHRLNTRESFGAYTALIYKKGALVLRMLHFLFSDPSTGDDREFFGMMKDFVSRYENTSATTEDFISVANEHFVRTPIARTYQIKDLNWFFHQWVYESALPSYEFSYWIEAQPDGSSMIHGTLAQRNAPAQWIMPLPLVVRLGKDKIGRVTVIAVGPERTINLHVPGLVQSAELDPDHWVLSDKTITSKASGKR
jgi:hypothetical protein